MAPKAVEKGAFSVGIYDAVISPVKLNGWESPAPCLLVKVKVTNLARQAVDYRGWHDAGTLPNSRTRSTSITT